MLIGCHKNYNIPNCIVTLKGGFNSNHYITAMYNSSKNYAIYIRSYTLCICLKELGTQCSYGNSLNISIDGQLASYCVVK